MKEDRFDELFESVREAGAILRGETEASRTFEFPKKSVVPGRRAHFGKSSDGQLEDEPGEG